MWNITAAANNNENKLATQFSNLPQLNDQILRKARTESRAEKKAKQFEAERSLDTALGNYRTAPEPIRPLSHSIVADLDRFSHCPGVDYRH